MLRKGISCPGSSAAGAAMNWKIGGWGETRIRSHAMAVAGALFGVLALRSVEPVLPVDRCQTVDANAHTDSSPARRIVRKSTAASTFDIANKPLSEFLAWVAQRTGRKLVYEGPDAEALAHRVRLRGSIVGLTPDMALAAVLPTTSLRLYRSPDDTLRVGIEAPIDSATAGRPTR
jgi:hypothetical protein